MKWIEAQMVKHPTPSQATDALIGDEEQNGKQKKTKRKKQGVGPFLRCEENEMDRGTEGETSNPITGN